MSSTISPGQNITSLSKQIKPIPRKTFTYIQTQNHLNRLVKKGLQVKNLVFHKQKKRSNCSRILKQHFLIKRLLKYCKSLYGLQISNYCSTEDIKSLLKAQHKIRYIQKLQLEEVSYEFIHNQTKLQNDFCLVSNI